jgi:hypothetical protein
LLSVLARQHQHAALELDGDLVGFDAGHVGPHEQLAVVAVNVDGRRPGGLGADLAGLAQHVIEHPVHPGAQLLELRERTPPGQTCGHGASSR